MVNVLIVEDQRMARERLESYIASDGRYRLVKSISNAALAEMSCMQNQVDLILMDVCTEYDESGLEAAARIKKHFPHIKIIIITSMAERSFIDRARAAGAESFWYKDVSQEELLDVVEQTLSGRSVYPLRTQEVQIGNASSYDFTARELDVLRLVVDGLPYAQIASRLNVSVDADKDHINNMLSTTGYSIKSRLAVAVTSKKLIIPEF